jgi:hypothetical protein
MPFDKHGCPGSEGNDWSKWTVTPFAFVCGGLEEETTEAPFSSYSAHLPSGDARRLPKEVHRPVRFPRVHSREAAGTRFFESMEGEGIAADPVASIKLMDRRKEAVLATSIVTAPPVFKGTTTAFVHNDPTVNNSTTKNLNI